MWSTFGKNWKNESGQSIPRDPLTAPAAMQSHVFFGHERSKNGDVYLVWDWGKPVLIIANEQIAQQFYKDQASHKRTQSFSFLGNVCTELLGNAIGTAYGKDWNRHRKAFKHDFIRQQGVNQRFSMIHRECKKWVDSLNDGTIALLSYSDIL